MRDGRGEHPHLNLPPSRGEEVKRGPHPTVGSCFRRNDEVRGGNDENWGGMSEVVRGKKGEKMGSRLRGSKRGGGRKGLW